MTIVHGSSGVPRTPRPLGRLWKQLVDEAGDDLIEQAAAVSVAQAEKDLAAVGFDIEAERASARAHIASLLAPRAPRRR